MKLLVAQERCDEAVARRDLAVELAFGERVAEIRDGFLRRSRVASQERADELEVGRVGHLPIRLAESARLRFGDALVGDRVAPQVRRRIAVAEAARLLQPVHQRSHCVDVEARGVQALETDAIGFVFVLAGEVDLRLDRERLSRGERRGSGRPRRRAGTRGGDRERQRGEHVEELVLFLRGGARHVALRDVRDFVREHRRQFGFGLRQQDEARVDADIAARQRERVDRGVGHREELELLPALRNRRDQPVTELVQIVVDLRVFEVGAARADLPHDHLADLVFLRRSERGLRLLAQVRQRLRVRGARAERTDRRRAQAAAPRAQRPRARRRPASGRDGAAARFRMWATGSIESERDVSPMLRCAPPSEVHAKEQSWQAREARRREPRQKDTGPRRGGRRRRPHR